MKSSYLVRGSFGGLAFEKEIMDGLYYVKGSLPTGANVTAVVLASEGEALYFDSLYYPNETARMIKIAEHEEWNPIGLVNTHWHVDHTAGNSHFNMHTIAHEQCAGLIRTELPRQLENARPKIGAVQVKYPDWTFEQRLKLTVGDKEVTFLHLPGHTPDSIVGLVEKDQVLIAGDTVMELPFIAYGNSQSLLESLQQIRLFDLKLIVQGHGEPCEKSKLEGDIEYVKQLRRIVSEEFALGETLEDMQRTPLDQFLTPDRIDELPELYKERIHKSNVERVFRELTESKN